jgi:omega-amidase
MRLTLSLVQMAVVLSNPAANLKKADEWLAEASRRGSELVVLPELWPTGGDWRNLSALSAGQAEVLEAVSGLAKKYGLWLNGSMLALNEAGQPANTSILFDPQGRHVGVYRKIHLFGLMREDHYLTAGQHLTVVATPWGQVGLAICYDLRFPEMFRAYALAGVTLVFLPAAWPSSRLNHWHALLRARAIENQLYMVGVNQAGSDGHYTYGGHSAIIDPWGETVVEAGESETLLTATIDTERVAEVRQTMPVFKDRRPAVYERVQTGAIEAND